LQCTRQRYDVEQSNVSLASLYSPDVISMKACKLSQLFLRQLTLKP
jgi:hypothetical protein